MSGIKSLAAIFIIVLVITFIFTPPSEPQLAQGLEGSEYISRVQILAVDQYNNTFDLQPVLLYVNNGTDNGETWQEFAYAMARVNGSGIGDFGDVHCFFQIWDARNVTGRGHVEYEYSRSSWSQDTIKIDGQIVVTLDLLTEGHDNPALGFFEGVFP